MLAAPAAPAAPGSTDSHGLDLAGMDPSVTPGDDFFAYANGRWIANTEIPADRSSWGPLASLRELTSRRTAELMQQAASARPGTDARKIGDYYATLMDESAIERQGLKPLGPQLARIAAIRDAHALASFLGSTLRTDVDPLNNTNFHTDNLFGLWVARSLNDPSRYEPFLLQGGLELPDRDYYLADSAAMAVIRDAYKAHIARVLALAGIGGAQAQAEGIFELEHRIAGVHWSRVDSEDVHKANNVWTRKDFGTRAPGLSWSAYFAASGLDQQNEFGVWQPSAITGIAALVASQPLEIWKEYLRFHVLEQAASSLPRAFVAEQFEFYGRSLAGTLQPPERWKMADAQTNAALGQAVGRLYVERYFHADDKARIAAMVRELIAAFAERIDRLEWMTPTTRERAKAKLATLRVGVGYPDRWSDYSTLKISRGDALGNQARAQLFAYQRSLAKLRRPVDPGEWAMTPQTVNAVNLPVMNALNFPAAFLQPPYFNPQRPLAMDYGAIGAIIGHEISHSFDDEGARFDAEGRLDNWWQAEDLAHFRAAAGRLARQFDAYRPFPDLGVNGEQTLSENIADLAGLALAYDALHRVTSGAAAAPSDGLTPDQQFFVSFGQTRRQKIRLPALRNQLITDGHAPDEYRADTVRNLDAWYAAFDVRPGGRLYLAPEERVRIW
jgi:predicted metalloendopeptidase